ncbi:hypothetical protein [Microbulbifer aggregans]|uniref:hypothetical protein n=1 Tax=Microbulbifer aggregans TaxID=1769779 RepID=UPI001CFE9D9D|nr:hypothetical protein [Microbulbifer aggregans]
MLPYRFLQLQLKYHGNTATFMAGAQSFRTQLHSAFINLAAKNSNTRATLLVHHPLHGWLQVCDQENRYPIIHNPLLLDCGQLWQSVIHTLAEADTWPTDEEKRRRKLEREMKRREEKAKALRRFFHIVKNSEH